MTDPIADMLTQIRNALLLRKPEVALPFSKFKQQLADILVREGMLADSSIVQLRQRPFLRLKLRYIDGRSVVSNLQRVSSPGQRVYAGAGELPRVKNGFGITVVSTSKGLLTDQQARKQHLGGEVICQVW